ncbi:TPA: fimbria/pilus outer membrane usher protein [Enterobacter chengduensis]|nr:fimbria/pilus outer membrane usher protein [Enterobacter chengduensis]
MKVKHLFIALSFISFLSDAETYDAEMLKTLGIDARTAALLEKGANFPPGRHPINIVINEQRKGIQVIEFNQQGDPCWTATIIEALGIDLDRFDSSNPACLKPLLESDILIEKKVELSSLKLNVSPEALKNNVQYATGGKAIVTNYDFRHYQYQPRGGHGLDSQTLTTELGANVEQWVFRSGQTYSRFNEQSTFTRLYGYAQRSIPGWSSVLQMGEITSADPLFSGIMLTGAQLAFEALSDNASLNQVNLVFFCDGAGSVEVWQGNVLLKTFTVNTGMNTLSSIPSLNQRDDFIIINHQSNGSRSQQTIPYIQATPATVFAKSGTSLAVGRLRLAENSYPLILGSTGILNNSRLMITLGGLASERYRAAAWKTHVRISDAVLATLSHTYSFAPKGEQMRSSKAGVFQQLGLNAPLTRRLSMSATANFRSRDYLDASNAWSLTKDVNRSGGNKMQYAAGMSYSLPWAGAFIFSGNYSGSWNGNHALGYTVGWGRGFGRVNVNVNLQKNRITTGMQHDDSRYISLNISIPLGSRENLRNWVSSTDNQTRMGASFDETVSDKFAWSLSNERSQHEKASLAGSGTWINNVAQLSGGLSRNDESTNYTFGARGAAVVHGEGITFTPLAVGDTFSVISLNSDRPDVKILTPGGAVWSDSSGHAIASWTAWQKNTIQIEPSSLPKNVHIPGGIIDLTPYRGSVVPVALPALTVRRALMTFPVGNDLAPGSPVRNSRGEFIAFANEDGSLFIDDLPEGALSGQRPDGSMCTIKIDTPWGDTPDQLYSTLKARCVK